MRTIRASFYARPLALYLALSLIVLTSLAGPADAMLLPEAPPAARTTVPDADRTADLARVQTVLESKVLQQRLMDYGLTPEETTARLNDLSDEELHQLAANLDAVQPGGSVVGTLLGVALIAGVVVLIIFLLEGRIAIEGR